MIRFELKHAEPCELTLLIYIVNQVYYCTLHPSSATISKNATALSPTQGPDFIGQVPTATTFHIRGPMLIDNSPYSIKVSIIGKDNRIFSNPISVCSRQGVCTNDRKACQIGQCVLFCTCSIISSSFIIIIYHQLIIKIFNVCLLF